ncbi:hypothetical protein [Sarcina ventriculi]
MENNCECRCQGGLLYKLNKYAEVHRELKVENLDLKYYIYNLENALLEIKQLAALKKDMHIVNLVEKTLKEDN